MLLREAAGLMKREIVLMALLGVQLLVVGFFFLRPTPPQPPSPFLDVGDTVSTIKARFRLRDTVLNFSGIDSSHILISVRSSCVWCTEAMPEIQAQLPRLRSRMRVTFISSESDTIAGRYLREHGVSADPLSLPQATSGAVGRALTSRTPWFFLLDSQGVIRRSSHTADLANIGADHDG